MQAKCFVSGMEYKNTTFVPNKVFDDLLPTLTGAELKLLLVIIRQTNGWINKRTGKRKKRDRITHTQFIRKTGLSRRLITTAIQTLIAKQVIYITNSSGECLNMTHTRRGQLYLYYSLEPYSKRTKKLTSIKDLLRNHSIPEKKQKTSCRFSTGNR